VLLCIAEGFGVDDVELVMVNAHALAGPEEPDELVQIFLSRKGSRRKAHVEELPCRHLPVGQFGNGTDDRRRPVHVRALCGGAALVEGGTGHAPVRCRAHIQTVGDIGGDVAGGHGVAADLRAFSRAVRLVSGQKLQIGLENIRHDAVHLVLVIAELGSLLAELADALSILALPIGFHCLLEPFPGNLLFIKDQFLDGGKGVAQHRRADVGLGNHIILTAAVLEELALFHAVVDEGRGKWIGIVDGQELCHLQISLL